jgi:drug/metabolite transporter (DMT)-like permease
MVVGALLGVEPLTARKSTGVGIAVLGVFAALASGLSAAPARAWRGELIMTGALLCMAFYNVRSRPFIQRSSALFANLLVGEPIHTQFGHRTGRGFRRNLDRDD